MKIVLNTVDNVKKFVLECEKYEGDIDVRQGRYVVDGKSMLGLYSLNLIEPVTVTMDGTDDEKMKFYNNIRQWEE